MHACVRAVRAFFTFASTPSPYQPGGGIPFETRTEEPTFTDANHDSCLPAMPVHSTPSRRSFR
jgi:hypothetical protein